VRGENEINHPCSSHGCFEGTPLVCKSSTKPVVARCVLRTSLGCDSLFRNSIEVGRRSISELLKLEGEAELNRSGVIRLATDHAERCGILHAQCWVVEHNVVEGVQEVGREKNSLRERHQRPAPLSRIRTLSRKRSLIPVVWTHGLAAFAISWVYNMDLSFIFLFLESGHGLSLADANRLASLLPFSA
jgi:hypothetical protein